MSTKKEHTVAVKSDGTVWDWGLNTYGELGNNTTTNSSTPVQVSNLTGAIAVAAGDWQTVAVKSDGTVWDWGRNATDGQLGNGNNTTNSSVPVQVSNMSGAVAVGAGGDSTFAVKSDGTLWGWGSDAYGQLCNNSTTNSDVPVQASGLTGVVAMSEGYHFTVALKSDGTVWTCGQNNGGQLGNGTTTDSHIPVQVSGLSGVIAISAGDCFGMALKSDGTIWTWGINDHGQLGNNSTTNSSVPVQVSGLNGAVALSGGEDMGIAVKSDGTAWAWGNNNDGQLGIGNTTDSHVPVQVHNISSVTQVAAGLYDTVAVKTDGTLWGSGNNADGELGNGTTTNTNLPTQSNMNSVASGGTSKTSATYSYNGDGLRMSKTVNGTTSQFTWDTSNSTPQLLGDGANNSPTLLSDGTNSYIYGPSGQPVEEITPAGSYYYHHDQLGSTRLLTDSNGNVAATYTYDPYGNLSGSTGVVTNSLRYAGAYTDNETGFLYLINRYYDPATTQFLTVDPLVSATRAAYGYVADDPLNNIDPEGTTGWDIRAGRNRYGLYLATEEIVGKGLFVESFDATYWNYSKHGYRIWPVLYINGRAALIGFNTINGFDYVGPETKSTVCWDDIHIDLNEYVPGPVTIGIQWRDYSGVPKGKYLTSKNGRALTPILEVHIHS